MSLPRLATLLAVSVLGCSGLTACGSSSSDSDDIPDIPTSTGAAVAPGNPADAKRWDGTWDSTFGTMQIGAGVEGKVNGTYSSCAGTIIATANGTKLTGTWTESDTTSPKCAGRPASHTSGSFTWTISGKTFKGTWTFSDGTKADDDSWTGKELF